MIASIIFLFVPALCLLGYQSVLETKGINDPTLAISLYKTTIVLDIAIKFLLICIIDDLDIFALVSMFIVLAFFYCFFVRLSLNVPKKSLRKFRKFPQETNYTLCAFKMIGWCLISVLFNLILLLFGWDFEEPVDVYYVLCFIMIAMMFPYMIFVARSLIRMDRLKYPSTRSLTALSHNNSPIVLLRSFRIDSNPTTDGKVFDETICENIDLYNNPIVSLANPDEILPSGGSLKIQAKDSEWKEVVKEVLKNCRAVILVEGLSDGLHWEISKLREYLDYKQLFVLIPSKTYRELAWCYNDEAGTGLYSIIRNVHHFIAKIAFSGRKDRNKILNEIWTDFSSKLRQFGINTPNNFPGDNCLLSFDENWNSIKLINIHKMHQMLDFIVSRTNTFNKFDFDYPKLGEKIASFEVNGFLSQDEIAPFRLLVDKCNRIGRMVALVSAALFVAGIILF
ncbi:MAG: hypothetical protein K2H04_08065 [Bacteroidaceae bacterium]|nr:hypothetical protein [Bacteroidaceae bacterium]